jgi:hypothetical protein
MKRKELMLAQRYATALEGHLAERHRGHCPHSEELGQEDVALGIEVLGMARSHEAALSALGPPTNRGRLMRDAQFFNEATGTLMDRHRTARRCRTALALVSAALPRRTSETTANRRMLERDQIRRKSLEASLKSRHDAQAAILKESLRLQDKLRQPIWRMIVMQDRQRRAISDRLRDEIAQSMIGINIGLSFLKAEAEMNATRLKGGITQARKQIRASMQELRRITSVDPKP